MENKELITLDYIYNRLNIEVKRFENIYKVKYNYEFR
jgi:hypothetical protein